MPFTDAKAVRTGYLLGRSNVRLRIPRWNDGAEMAALMLSTGAGCLIAVIQSATAVEVATVVILSAHDADVEHRQSLDVTKVVMIHVSDLVKTKADLASKIRVGKGSVLPQLFF
jgi:hypothetical protein